MALPARKVELGFDGNGPGSFFVLDDPTAGVLDNTQYVLAGAAYYDVTQYVKSISINRGKNRELDRFNAGSLNVQFNNQNRYFDPTNTSSPFYGQIVPRREVRVTAGTVVQFYGLVDDWDLDYSITGLSDASLTAFDGFSRLAGQTLTAGTATPQLSGARINAVLNDSGVQWPSTARAIDAGGQTLQADVIAVGTNAIQYINTIEQSEPGIFFIDKSGNATFRDRNRLYASSNAVVLSDDGSGIPYADIKVNYGSELLYNQAELTRLNGGVAVADDLLSQSTYGVRTYEAADLLMDTDTALGELAVRLVSQYADPEYRFESLSVVMSKLSEAQQNSILGLEIGSICRIKFQPNKVGAVIDKYAQVIGVQNQMSIADHRVVLAFQTIDAAYFVLDDPAFGLLDYNSLGF
jgi:predicted RecA/RadA family phage recombinase